MELSKLGLGCVTFGREIDREAAFKLMDYAYLKGINFFDTAAAYSSGVSELIIGQWIKERKLSGSTVTVATKILPPFSPFQIRSSVEESRKRLNTAGIDILYLHRWDESLADSSAWVELNNLVEAGKVKELGVSNFNAAQLNAGLAIQKESGFECLKHVQNNHNLAVSDLSTGLIEICRANSIKIVTFSPLGAGFLTGKHINGVEKGSRFDRMPAHQDIYFTDSSSRRLQNLLKVAASTGHTAAHLALAWAIHQPEVCSVLIGGRTTAQLDQAFNAAKFDSPKLFEELQLL